MPVPAARLLHVHLPNGWVVTEQIPKSPGSTGGTFSYGYVVTNSDGRKAFLKAIDFSEAFKTADPARLLQAMTAAFNFERDVLELCRQAGLNRVVVALDHGTVNVDPGSPIGLVQY